MRELLLLAYRGLAIQGFLRQVAAFWLKKPTIGCCMEIDTEPPAIYCNRFVKYFFRKFTTLESLRGEPSSSESNVR